MPYNEDFFLMQVGPAFFKAYQEAGRIFGDDAASVVWPARTQADIDMGLSQEASLAKHEYECRAALGLLHPPPPPPPSSVRQLVPKGQFFTLPDGTPQTVIQCSDFNLFNRYQRGEDVDTILHQRRQIGFNDLRVWTAFDVQGIGRLVLPQYEQLPAFLDQCGRYGFTVELTGFAGPYETIFHNDDEKVGHWEAILEWTHGVQNVRLELVNERDNPPNRDLPFSRLRRPSSMVCSNGSMTADTWPIEPVWDYAQYHSNSLNEWQRKVGHNAMEIADRYQIPVVSNENTRFPDNDDHAAHAYDAAQAAALLCAGSCGHSVRGKTSELWDGRELECMAAWAEGARAVPLIFQQGSYHHRTDLEMPGVIRAYDRALSDGRRYEVLIRA